jgi:hypothetical protein
MDAWHVMDVKCYQVLRQKGQSSVLQRHLADVGCVLPREPCNREVLAGCGGATLAGVIAAAAAAALLACCSCAAVQSRHLRRGAALAAGRLRSAALLQSCMRQRIGRWCRGAAAAAAAARGAKERSSGAAAVACSASSVTCASTMCAIRPSRQHTAVGCQGQAHGVCSVMNVRKAAAATPTWVTSISQNIPPDDPSHCSLARAES